VAEYVQANQHAPDSEEVGRIFDDEFFLPLATKATHRELKARARRHVEGFIDSYAEELQALWAVERPFELRTPDALVSGRADVILHDAGGDPRLTIVDYKTTKLGTDDDGPNPFEFQLQVYGEAGQQEGLDVAGAYVHELVRDERVSVAVDAAALSGARGKVDDLVLGLKADLYEPSPGPACGRCDVAPICRHRQGPTVGGI
jgi:DNA helicase-2/ATP-dependent DNA helicase PcrA